MQAVTTVGLDIAKSVFQIHGVDAHGNVVVRRQLKRRVGPSSYMREPGCCGARCSHVGREKNFPPTERLHRAVAPKPSVRDAEMS